MPLPDRPNLRHLRDQAKDLLRSGAAATLADAPFQIARRYGFPSWPKLKLHVESLDVSGQLKQAIDANDLVYVQELLTSNPEYRHGPTGTPAVLAQRLATVWASPSTWSQLIFPAR